LDRAGLALNVLTIGAAVVAELNFSENAGVIVMSIVQTGHGVGGSVYPYIIEHLL